MINEFSYHDLGIVFQPKKEFSNLRYAQIPTPILINDDVIRVFLSGRNKKNQSFIYHVDVKSSDPTKIIATNENPLLDFGKKGHFDEHGIMPSCAFRKEKKIFLFYSGWSLRKSVPYNNLMGLALSSGEKKFYKPYQGPILGQCILEPLSATSPWICEYGNQYIMYYCSGIDWLEIDGKLEHTYDIKIAKSKNLISWNILGKVAIGQNNFEQAITRPTVIKINKKYHMWFCFRDSRDFRNGKGSYKIGHAKSENMINWKRSIHQVIPENGWNRNSLEMQAYPAAIKTKDFIFIFYNGNSFGKTGFGVISLNIKN